MSAQPRPHAARARSEGRLRRAGAARARRRRRAVVALALSAIAVTLWLFGGSSRGEAPAGLIAPQRSAAQAPDRTLRIVLARRREAMLSLTPLTRQGRLDSRALHAAVERALPDTARLRHGDARVVYRYDTSATARAALAVGPDGGIVTAVRRAESATIAAPVIRQAERNTCETAALSILLATAGVRVSQERLQRQLPRSGPLDPRGSGSERVWGDPELGYVGRGDGGGAAGGFGVYPGPVAAVAKRNGTALSDLTRASPRRVYRRLLDGRAVMAWVGLSEGPYDEWRSPRGRRVRVNFGEHTVVLTGVRRDGSLRIVNPLQGTVEIWSRRKFEAMWSLLGRRALST